MSIPSYDEWCRQVQEEVLSEIEVSDPVSSSMRYACYMSRSKGGQNNKVVKAKSGKTYGPYRHYGPYRRKHPEEVELVTHRGGQSHLWHRFPFDVYATEIFGSSVQKEDAEDKLKEELRSNYKRKKLRSSSHHRR